MKNVAFCVLFFVGKFGNPERNLFPGKPSTLAALCSTVCLSVCLSWGFLDVWWWPTNISCLMFCGENIAHFQGHKENNNNNNTTIPHNEAERERERDRERERERKRISLKSVIFLWKTVVVLSKHNFL